MFYKHAKHEGESSSGGGGAQRARTHACGDLAAKMLRQNGLLKNKAEQRRPLAQYWGARVQRSFTEDQR